MKRSGVILAAHGSRTDPSTNGMIQSLARRLRDRHLFDEVAVAFHAGTPTFATVLDEMTATDVTVVPVMTSKGYYCHTVLPRELAKNHRYGGVKVNITEPVGTHPLLLEIVKQRLSNLCAEYEIYPSNATLALVGHGTERHQQSRTATIALVEELRRVSVCGQVVEAFLDEAPSIESIPMRASGDTVFILPFLIGEGAHAKVDIPSRLGLSDGNDRRKDDTRRYFVDRPIGQDERILDIIVDLAGKEQTLQRDVSAGTVYLIGAGPGDPDLITVRGLSILKRAHVVVYDRLVAQELVARAPSEAEKIDVGKQSGGVGSAQDRINALLVDRAGKGKVVARLKGGDPFIFGRGFEELTACREAGITCIVVPGVSSVVAAPAAAGIPLTQRHVARSLAVVTARTCGDRATPALDYGALASIDTVVILMGRGSLRHITRSLQLAGRDPETPAACIERATTPRQRVTVATLDTLADAADRDGLCAPVVTVIGDVAAFAAQKVTEEVLGTQGTNTLTG